MTEQPWSRQEFEQRLRDKGRAYHIHHPFNVMLNSGRATPEQIRGWVANRFYYQINIPIKDAAILANCTDRQVRRSGHHGDAQRQRRARTLEGQRHG